MKQQGAWEGGDRVVKGFQNLCLIDALWASARDSQDIDGQGEQTQPQPQWVCWGVQPWCPGFGMCEGTPQNMEKLLPFYRAAKNPLLYPSLESVL